MNVKTVNSRPAPLPGGMTLAEAKAKAAQLGTDR